MAENIIEDISIEEPETVSIEEIESNVSDIEAQPDAAPQSPLNQEALKDYRLDTGLFSLSNRDGDRIYVTEEELPNALTNFEWNLEPKKLYNAIKDAEFRAHNLSELGEGEDQALNTINSLFNVASGGLTDLIRLGLYKGLDKTGLFDDYFSDKIEYEKALKEANPLVTLAGDIGGLINPYGVFAKAGKATYGVSKGLFTKLIGKSADKGFKKWGVKVLAGGTTGVLEDQAFKATSFVKESILTNTDMNAESFFAHQKEGSGWSFLIGGVAGGLPGAISKARSGISSAVKKINPIDNVFNSVVNKGDSAVQNAKKAIGTDILGETLGKYGDDYTDAHLKTITAKHSKVLDDFEVDLYSKLDDKIDNVGIKNKEILDEAKLVLADTAYTNPTQANKDIIKSISSDIKKNFEKITKGGTKELNDWANTFSKKAETHPIYQELDEALKAVIDKRIADFDPKFADDLAKLNTKRKAVKELSDGLNKSRNSGSLFNTNSIGVDIIGGLVADYAFDGDVDLEQWALTTLGLRARTLLPKLLKRGLENSAKRLYKAQQGIDAIETTINSNVSKALRFKRPGGISASANFLSNTKFEDLPDGSSKEDKIQYLTIKLDEYDSKTDMLEQRTIAGVESFNSSMPETAKGVMDRQVKMVEFLKGKIPRDPRSETMDLMNKFNKREWKPSKYQIREFEKYLSASVAPMTVFEDIGKGRVSVQQMEALQVLYPEMYKYMTFSVITEVASSTTPIPYPNRVKLSLVMGMPLDSSLEPATIRALQLLGTPQEKQPDTGMVSSVAPNLKPKQTGLNKLKIGSRANSTLDAALNRGLE